MEFSALDRCGPPIPRNGYTGNQVVAEEASGKVPSRKGLFPRLLGMPACLRAANDGSEGLSPYSEGPHACPRFPARYRDQPRQPDAGAERLTVPAIRQRKKDGVTDQPVVMLTAYTARQATVARCALSSLLVGIAGAGDLRPASSVPVTLDIGGRTARRWCGSYHAAVVVDMPFGAYEGSPEQALRQRLACSRRRAARR
jgi:hypothetical protein